MKLITISGLDGSGKSTQIELLKNYLESQNKRVFYFHAIEFGLAKKIVNFRNKYCLLCRLLGKCDVYREKSAVPRSNSQVGEFAIGVTKANAFEIFLRKIFLRIDLWRFNLLRNKLRNSGYDYILSDRYFYDTLVNIKYLNGGSASIMEVEPPKPDLAIYLEISPENIMQRERKPDQGLIYLEKKFALYEKAAEIWKMKMIDGNQKKEEIFEEIKKYLI